MAQIDDDFEDAKCLPPAPRSWRLGCKTRGDSQWAYNSLRFPTKEACLAYGADLHFRWTALDQYEAHPSDDAPNR